MRQFLRVAAFPLLTGGSLAALGLLSHELDRAISLLGLGLFFATFAGALTGTSRPDRGATLAGALCLAAAIPAARLAPMGVLSFHLLVLTGAAFLGARAPRAVRLELQAYVWAVCAVVLATEVARLFPLVWHMKLALAHGLSHLSELLPRPATFGETLEPWKWTREPRNLGPTAMGLPLLGALVAVALGRAAVFGERGRPRLATIVLVLVLTHLGYLLLLTPYASWMARHHQTWAGPMLNSQWLFLVLGAAMLSLLLGRPAWKPVVQNGAAAAGSLAAAAGVIVAPNPRVATSWRRRVGDPRVVSGLCLGLLLVLGMGRITPPASGPVRVMLYDAGYTNWSVPQRGQYGEHSAGMFGVLPGLLQAAGHQVERSDDLRRLTGPNAPDCLVLINIQEYLEPADRERVLDFVRNGGGLLCLGDHTGVAGIRGPFNDLLGPIGIHLNFDSATFFANGWTNGLERRSHPLNLGVANDEDYQIWVGASLALDPNATPVVVGRYGWSDAGDMANLKTAYLGDRRYNPDELLGDLVLAGEARFGRGKILMFGDTSTYQNLALPRSWDFALRSVAYLGHGGGAPPGIRVQVVALLLSATLLGIVTGGGTILSPVAAACAGLLIGSASVSALVRPHATPVLDWSKVTPTSLAAAVAPMHGSAIIDRSHGGRFDLRSWNDTSIGGLMLNLMRDGFFPIVSETFPEDQLEKADVAVLLAPQRGYSTAERRVLRRFVERGGRLLVCVGHEELDGARELLRDYGLGVRDLPLAHFRTGPDKSDLVFLEGWSVESPANARVLVRQWGQPVVASLPVGRGTIVLIGDTRYLLNRNLEGRESWLPGNVAFLSALDSGQPVSLIEGKYGDPREQGALADAPARSAPVATPRDSTVTPARGQP